MSPKKSPGVVYTRAWVAELMLDLAGYDVNKDLGEGTFVDPGCGPGAFLLAAVDRLIVSARAHRRDLRDLEGAILGVELDGASASTARSGVQSRLADAGLSSVDAKRLAEEWVREADFLATDFAIRADWVVGNPPYVRVEESDAAAYAGYRRRWSTMSGRADLYIGFFQAALEMLAPGGSVVYLCADRWMHNLYGSALRRKVASEFDIRLVLELHDSDVFESKVAAYPAITVFGTRAEELPVLATADSGFDAPAGRDFARWFASGSAEAPDIPNLSVARMEARFPVDRSWPSGPPERLALIERVEAVWTELVETGVQIGVGIATGADRVFVVDARPAVEEEFLVKAIGPSDLTDGAVVWRGRWMVSPWHSGELASIDEHPGLGRYMNSNSNALKARYVAKKHNQAWWRTIDRPAVERYAQPKLVVADINDAIEPVLDREGYWPLHSVYYMTSGRWDLEVLGGILLSDVAAAFIQSYSVRMASGHLRVSAQYLRKIRLPIPETISEESAEGLRSAFEARDRKLASAVVDRLLDQAHSGEETV